MSQKVFPVSGLDSREWTFSNEIGSIDQTIRYPNVREQTFIHKAEELGFYKCKCNRIISSLVKKPEGDKLVCGCGLAVDEHSSDAINDTSGSKWDRDRCTVRDGLTDAYGSISFLGASEVISQYIKIHYQTEINSIIDYLFEKPQYWRLPKPKLIISVTGGAKINLKPRIKDSFSKGLVKVATTTNALIVTGGSYNGCMKLVGEAFKNNALSIDLAQRIILLGITNWGSVANKEKLIKYDNSNLHIPVEYDMIKRPHPYYISELLDPNHTHFLLVDDSTVKFGGEVQFRAAVTAEISKNYNIPIVVLVVGGGPRTIDNIYESVVNGSPVVLLEGSGESCDIMAFALKKFDDEKKARDKANASDSFIISDKLRQEIRLKFKKDYPKKEEKEINQMTESLIKCLNVDLRHLYTVCRNNDDIDVAILNALLRSSIGANSEKMNRFQVQLSLALAWNRADIAREFIFTDEIKDQIGSLDSLMFEAILTDRVEFVSLFLENGFGLKNFVTHRLLFKLYNSIPEDSMLYKLLMRQKQLKLGNRFKKFEDTHLFRFKGIGEAIQKLTGNIFSHRFTKRPYSNLNYDQSKEINDNTDNYGKRISKEPQTFLLPESDFLSSFSREEIKFNIDDKVTYAEHELFMFSILLDRSEMAKLFCQYSNDSICSALVTTIMFQSYAKLNDSELEECTETAKEFENFALELLETYYNKDDSRASCSLLRKITTYDNCTSMQVAVAGKNLSFIAHPCFQKVLINYWYGRILPDVSKKKLFLAIFLPLIAHWIVNFRKEVKRDVKKNDEEAQVEVKETQMNSVEYSTETDEELKNQHVNLEDMKYCKKIYYFMTAPFVMFIYHQVFFILFLILFSYVILCDFYPIDNTTNMWVKQGIYISAPEIVLIIWVFTFAMEKVHEFLRVDRSLFKAKVREFFFDMSTVFDLAAIGGFFVAEILRFIPSEKCYLAARILLCINIIFWYLKSMYCYKFLKNVGPKIYMIKEMLFQLAYFLLIVVLFMFAFGVSTQALLYHNQKLDSNLLKSVFFPAFFFIGGEYYTKWYFLDITKIDTACTNNNDTAITDIYDPINNNDCPEVNGSIIGLILYIFYLLFLNILLVNLLIAIFNNTYQMIESEANKIWKSDRYNLVFSYYHKPFLPPPLIIFSYIRLAFQFIVQKILQTRNQDRSRTKLNPLLRFFIDETQQGFVYEFSDENKENSLIKWESYNTDEYIFNLEKKSKESIDYRLVQNGKKLEDLCMKFDEILENENFEFTKKVDGINQNIMTLLNALK